jgi:hypothetical protein
LHGTSNSLTSVVVVTVSDHPLAMDRADLIGTQRACKRRASAIDNVRCDAYLSPALNMPRAIADNLVARRMRCQVCAPFSGHFNSCL